MLIYHPAFDAHHCAFRMLVVTECVASLEVDKARLLDFYLLFPSTISSVRLPEQLKEFRKLAKEQSNIFRDPINPRTTFREMRHIQSAALKCIAASGLLDIADLEIGFVKRTNQKIPTAIKSRINNFLSDRQPFAEQLMKGLANIPLGGANGLKDRSGLMEYRYDIT